MTDYPQRACPRFESCSAILCPIARREYLAELRGFLPEEDDICARVDQCRNPLVVKQKRLRKAHATGLFTLLMIESLKRISKGLQGLKLEDSYGSGLHAKALRWIRSYKQERHVRGASAKVV
jgi:hypothetical protein